MTTFAPLNTKINGERKVGIAKKKECARKIDKFLNPT